MTLDTEERIDQTALEENSAKPPPHIGEEVGHGLFQSMDELRVRHGNTAGGKQRLVHAAAALLAGLLLFIALYTVILFL